MTTEQAAFGSDLRRHREKRQISLTAVAESTKIKQSLLAALELGDAAHWPSGIYGRGFLREYAIAIGLPPESVVEEFLRVFGEPGADPAESRRALSQGLRLRLADQPARSPRDLARRAAAVLIDAGVIVALSALAWWLVGSASWTTTAVVAVAYASVATVVTGRSTALSLAGVALVWRRTRTQAAAPRPSSRELLHIVAAQPRPQPVIRLDADAPDFSDVLEQPRAASR